MKSISIFAVLALAFSCTLAFDVTLNQHWNLWKQTYRKQYPKASEENLRRAIWKNNLKIVNDHNREADLGVHTYWLGMNAYADMSIDEFNRAMTGFNVSTRVHKRNTPFFIVDANAQIPDAIDWRTKGYVTPIQNQGQCGSSWAFSAAGALEGQHFAKTGKLVPLSAQNLVDCSQAQGNAGCQGGMMDLAFTYVQVNKGIDTNTSYPYEAVTKTCRFKAADVGATATGFVDIQSQNESALQQAVATIGPISAAVFSHLSTFQFYKHGVYNESNCNPLQVDHSVLVVGYGSENNQDYWIVKNSWGTDWGEQGYIRIVRNKNNECGIATQGSYPTI